MVKMFRLQFVLCGFLTWQIFLFLSQNVPYVWIPFMWAQYMLLS